KIENDYLYVAKKIKIYYHRRRFDLDRSMLIFLKNRLPPKGRRKLYRIYGKSCSALLNQMITHSELARCHGRTDQPSSTDTTEQSSVGIGRIATRAAVGALLLLGGTAMAADLFSGGGFYDTTSGCAAGSSGDSYIGECRDNGDTATGADVKMIDGGSDTADNVFGGYSEDGDASDNKVTIAGDAGSVSGRIIGGAIEGNGDADGNKVVVKDNAEASSIWGARIFGDGDASNNSVTVTSTNVANNASVTGAVVYGKGDVKNNEVIIAEQAEVGSASGGGTSRGSNAHGNVVKIIDEARVRNSVKGGTSAHGGSKAENNKVIIADEAKVGDIEGGYVNNSNAGGSTVTGNVVTIT